MNFRVMMSLVCHLRITPKEGDFVQAFCQSLLSKYEQYVCKQPLGCKFTPPKTYLRLRKTLYGLKRSPRH